MSNSAPASLNQSALDSSAGNATAGNQSERRLGLADRREAIIDRRNEDRVNDDLNPRRDPDCEDRRQN